MAKKNDQKDLDVKSSIEKLTKSFYTEKDGITFLTNITGDSQIDNLKVNTNLNLFKESEEYEMEQGDILVDYPKSFLNLELKEPIGLIISNYTCDIPKRETTRLYVLPVFPLKILSYKLLQTFVETLATKKTRSKVNFENPTDLKQNFDKLGTKEKQKFIEYIRSIFQFKNRNYFLLCPHKELRDNWSYADIQTLVSIKKDLENLIEIIKYTKISISSPWKERFGSVISSRFGKIAVDHFSNQDIGYIFTNL